MTATYSGLEVSVFDRGSRRTYFADDLAQRFQDLISEAMVELGQVFEPHPWEGNFAIALVKDDRSGRLTIAIEPESPRSDAEFAPRVTG
jgi:hypothetical protein